MSVDLTVAQKRVTALLNANAKNADGSMVYSTAVADDRRHATEILDNVTEAALVVLRAIAETPSNGNRNSLMADSAEIVHRGRIPDHIGPIGVVKIQAFADDEFKPGLKRPAHEIESYRTNANSFYAETAHDQQDENGFASPLAGFWDVLADELFYTGSSARVPVANFTRADAATKVPDAYEDVVVALGFSLSVKTGDINLGAMASHFQGYANNALVEIRAGASVVPPIPEAQSKGA